jgi:hypothetical protein
MAFRLAVVRLWTWSVESAATLSGDCILTSTQALDLVGTGVDDHIMNWGVLKSFLEAPTAIGAAGANTGAFTTLTADSFAGTGMATSSDIKSVTPPTDHVVSAAVLVEALQKSSVHIGGTTPGAADFTTVTASKVYSQVGTSSNKSAGYFTTLAGDTCTFADVTITGAFTLDSQITPAEGGTGISTYTKGDLLVATDASTLTKLNVGSDFEVLYADSAATPGVSWGTVLPKNYLEMTAPTFQTSAQYVIKHCTARNSANDGNIVIAGQHTLDIATTGLNGIAAVADFGSDTIDSTGTTVTGTSATLTTDFQIGDVITSGSDVRVVTAVGGSSLTVNSAFTSDLSAASYGRGGRAASVHYYIYALGHASTPGYILSTRCVATGDTLVDLPSGYSDANMRQLPYVITTDGSANVVYVIWSGNFASVLSPQPNTSVGSTNFTACDFSASVPKISTLARVETKLYNNAGGANYVKLSPTVSGTYYSSVLSQAANGTYFEETSVALNSNSQFLYASLNSASGSSTATMTLHGYYVNVI